jgi:glycosyltransferase involved in cell wall biosynthesis
VDPRVFAPVAERTSFAPFEGGDTELLRIVCVASLEEVKGHRFVIEACRLLQERGVRFTCQLVGDGPLRARLERQASEAGIASHVHFLGGQPRPVVARLLAESDVAVLGSHPTPEGRREGIPVALMEAMAAGLPVVATAISGIPELVVTGVTGVLVPSGDATALAGGLQRLAEDPDLRRRMGRAGRARVLSEFDLRTNTEVLVRLFLGDRTEPRAASA